MLATLFLIVSISAGFTLTYFVPMRLTLGERLFIGSSVGLAVSSLATFKLALAFGLSALSISLAVGLMALAVMVSALSSAHRQEFLNDLRRAVMHVRERRNALLIAVFGLFAGLLGLILGHAIFIQDGTLYAAFTNVWGDWNQHLSQATSFAYADNIPPELNVLSGQRLSYPFITNFLSAILIKGGYSLIPAMVIPGILLGICTLGLLMSLTVRLAGRLAGVLSPWLFFLAGGLGFLRAFPDFLNSNQSFGYFISHLTKNYTQTGPGGWFGDINWINPIYAYVVPQRAFIFGAPLVLTVLLLMYQALLKRRRSLLLPAGLVVALLPLIHTHALVFIGFVTPGLIALTIKRTGPLPKDVAKFWLPFLLPVALLALPQFLWLTHGLATGKFLRLQFAWTAYDENAAWFWFKNMGLFLPLVLYGLVSLRHAQPLLVKFITAIASVFIIANLVVFQPWDWDNSKLFVYWFIATIPLVSCVLARLWRRSKRWKAATAAMLLSLTLAGALDASRGLQWQSYKLPMLSKDDQAIADYVRAHATTDGVFLTAQDANNPISGLSGRSIVLGYTGWIWSYGLEYLEREKDVAAMFEAKTDPLDLLRRYEVDYVVIGPRERASNRLRPNENYYRTRYRTWYEHGMTVIFDINRPITGPGDASAP